MQNGLPYDGPIAILIDVVLHSSEYWEEQNSKAQMDWGAFAIDGIGAFEGGLFGMGLGVSLGPWTSAIGGVGYGLWKGAVYSYAYSVATGPC
jgi:hypothetical protein